MSTNARYFTLLANIFMICIIHMIHIYLSICPIKINYYKRRILLGGGPCHIKNRGLKRCYGHGILNCIFICLLLNLQLAADGGLQQLYFIGQNDDLFRPLLRSESDDHTYWQNYTKNVESRKSFARWQFRINIREFRKVALF